MNILFLTVLVTAVHAHTPTPFHWEFDLRSCDRHYGGFDCYAPVNGVLVHVETKSRFERMDYQMHPHVIAINSQGPKEGKANRWQIIMQTRSRKQKVDLAYGMILHRLHSSKNESKFVECSVVEGKVVLRHAPELESELVDSFFYDDHLYCDFVLWMRKDSGQTMSDLTTNHDKFALSVSVDGVVQKYADSHDYGKYEKWSSDHDFIAEKLTSLAGSSENHECNVSQVIYDPVEAPSGGKLRSWEVFGDKIGCPDERYIIHASDNKGRRLVNANIWCRNGRYEISNHVVTSHQKEWTVEKGETVNVFCHVEEKNLCPISIPCDGSDCPYVTFSNIGLTYRLDCPDSYQILIVGERESPFRSWYYTTYCNWQRILFVYGTYIPDEFKSPNTPATEAYCVHKDVFVHTNCTRRDPLCNGKSCSIVKSEKPHKYSVTCTNPNHVFQEFSTASKQWSDRDKELHCQKNGDWGSTWQKFVRCKDPKDASPPVEWEAPQTKSKADSKASANEEITEKGAENGQTMIGHSVALLIATVIVAGI